jgi:hypothetical protein
MSVQRITIGHNYLCHQSRKLSFVALAVALRRGYDARVSYLQAANQFMANRVALEQAVGAPLGE